SRPLIELSKAWAKVDYYNIFRSFFQPVHSRILFTPCLASFARLKQKVLWCIYQMPQDFNHKPSVFRFA
ncbi:hypothetical protein ACFL6I_28865, partial [candidate division KSB1 bacterium]